MSEQLQLFDAPEMRTLTDPPSEIISPADLSELDPNSLLGRLVYRHIEGWEMAKEDFLTWINVQEWSVLKQLADLKVPRLQTDPEMGDMLGHVSHARVITLNSTASPYEQLLTLGHELGHLVMWDAPEISEADETLKQRWSRQEHHMKSPQWNIWTSVQEEWCEEFSRSWIAQNPDPYGTEELLRLVQLQPVHLNR